MRGQAVVALVCLVQLGSCISNGAEWQQLQSQCFSDSAAAVLQQQVQNARQCAFAAQSVDTHSVAEFNSNTGQCSVFRYQSVCHLIHAAAADAGSSCTVFARLPVKSASTFVRMQKKLRAAWVFGNGSEWQSVACGESQPWTWNSVAWSAEGAVFDGATSNLTLRDADFGNFSLGFTWLLRLKRQVVAQPFVDNFNCDTGVAGAHLTEGFCSRCLHFFSFHQFETNRRVYTNSPAMTAAADQFNNIGITAVPAADSYTFYSQGAFVPQSDLGGELNAFARPTSHNKCFRLGTLADTDPRRLQGTVRAVAIANETMTVEEINSFFDLVA